MKKIILEFKFEYFVNYQNKNGLDFFQSLQYLQKTIKQSSSASSASYGLITSILLFNYGSGPIKGFAVTLSIGILSSMFSALMLTKLMIVFWMKQVKPTKIEL